MYSINWILWILLIVIYLVGCNSQTRRNVNQAQQSLAERVGELNRMSLKKSVIRLNTEKFRLFVGSKSLPRNYSVVVMMTALSPHRQCQVCRSAHDEFLIVANSFRYSPAFQSQLYFAMVDFDEGSEIFQQLSLNSAPIFLHFSPKGKLRSPDTMDVQRVGFHAEVISKWIAEKTDIQIRVIRPPSYSGIIIALIAMALVGSLLYVRRNNLEFLYNRTSWALASLSIVFAMTSGQMWNHIRGPPLMQKTQRGIAYIHGSTNGQFVIETYIVIILNTAIAFGMILINESMKNKGDAKKKKVTAIIGIVLVAIFFSFLMSLFRMKASGYPYSFLFK